MGGLGGWEQASRVPKAHGSTFAAEVYAGPHTNARQACACPCSRGAKLVRKMAGSYVACFPGRSNDTFCTRIPSWGNSARAFRGHFATICHDAALEASRSLHLEG